jgi:hypothetical protein
MTRDQVLTAFGADPAQRPARRIKLGGTRPWLVVLEVASGWVAVEDNGFQGSLPEILKTASTGGRAASMFWNDIGDSAIGFAENGVVLDASDFLPGVQEPSHPELNAMVDEIARRAGEDTVLCGLLALERFIGIRIDAHQRNGP